MQERSSSRRRLLVALACAGTALLSPCPATRAHTPITTKILFNREVIRILQQNCLGCHRPGGIAPMSLASYEEARPWAKAIKEELLERRMPPWLPVKGYGEFRNAPPLTQRDVDAIVNWVEGGAPKGDAKLLPPGPLLSTDWPLGQPDLVLWPSAPSHVAADADERRELVLPTKLAIPAWLSAVDLRPGDASVVHCADVLLDGPRPALLGTWVPGLKPAAWPDDTALKLPAGARLRVRIHYKGAGQAAIDRSSLGVYFSRSERPRELREIALLASGSSVPLTRAADAIAIVPLADPRLASLQATVYRRDGTSEVLVWTRDHRDDWQPAYFFKTPVSIPKGSRIEAIAHLREDADALAPAELPPNEPLVRLYYASPLAVSARRAGAPGS